MSARAGRRLALAISLVLGASVGTAHATSITGTQLRSLAASAANGDAAALAELRGVDRVDGQPAALAAVLSAGSAAELRARLDALAEPRGTSAPATRDPQAAAAAVLHGRRFDRAPLPDPVATGVGKLGGWLGRLARKAPGGPVVFWIALALVVLGVAGLGARRMLRRLEPARRVPAAGGQNGSLDPAELERQAKAAEARAAFAEAVRLRFQAGLLALDARGRLEYRPSLLTSEARRRVDSNAFDELATQFEQVAYGEADASAADAETARERWRSLLAAGGRR